MLSDTSDQSEEDVASLLAPRFRREPVPTPPTPPTEAPEPETAVSSESPTVAAPLVSPPIAEPPASAPTAPEATPAPADLSELANVASATASVAPALRTADAATAIVGNERFLPVAEPVITRPPEPGTIRIFVPVGTAVHVIEEGRVAEIDEHIGGEVTVRAVGDRFYHYRRLLPSSVCVESGVRVAAGTIIGTVGESIDDDPPCLVVGLQSGDGTWADICTDLVGLSDPGELGLCAQRSGEQWVDPLAADRDSTGRS